MERINATTVNNLATLLYLLDWFKNNFDGYLLNDSLITEKMKLNDAKRIVESIFKIHYPKEFNDRVERCSVK